MLTVHCVLYWVDIAARRRRSCCWCYTADNIGKSPASHSERLHCPQCLTGRRVYSIHSSWFKASRIKRAGASDHVLTAWMWCQQQTQIHYIVTDIVGEDQLQWRSGWQREAWRSKDSPCFIVTVRQNAWSMPSYWATGACFRRSENQARELEAMRPVQCLVSHHVCWTAEVCSGVIHLSLLLTSDIIRPYCWELEYDYITITVQGLILTCYGVLLSFVIQLLCQLDLEIGRRAECK